jgi:hypothetical protein
LKNIASKSLNRLSGLLNNEVSLHKIKTRRCLALAALAAALLLASGLSGCQKILVTKDSTLKPIQEMLEKSVPVGTTRANVAQYLASQGFPEERTDQPGMVIATIRMVDSERMQSVTARARFYFDANGKLNTFELHRIPNQPLQ